jgi:hypothetical protein
MKKIVIIVILMLREKLIYKNTTIKYKAKKKFVVAFFDDVR